MLIILFIAVFHSIKATFNDASINKISKDIAQKHKQLLEEEQEYDVDKLSDVRECDTGELEFLTTWKGYEDCTWEKNDTLNGHLSKYCISSLFSSCSVTPILQTAFLVSSNRGRSQETC